MPQDVGTCKEADGVTLEASMLRACLGELGIPLLFKDFNTMLVAQVEFLVTLGATCNLFTFGSLASYFAVIVDFPTFNCASLPRDS